MRINKYYPFVISALLLLGSCDTVVHEVGNGNMVSEDIEIENFEEIVVSGSFKILLERGVDPGLNITADENLMQYINPKVVGDRLVIETTESIRSEEGLELVIKYTKLTALEVSGAASISSSEVIKGDYFNINMSGAGAVDLNVELKALKITLSGAGAVDLAGSVREQNVRMSGAGGLDAYDLVSQTCKIQISGVGSAKINVQQSLNAEVSGVGGITYRGNPEEIISDVSGLGSISRSGGDK